METSARESRVALENQLQAITDAIVRLGTRTATTPQSTIPPSPNINVHAFTAPPPPPPTTATMPAYDPRYKSTIPDVEILNQDSYKAYAQWKFKCEMKLAGDRPMFRDTEHVVTYIISRTGAKAFRTAQIWASNTIPYERTPEQLWTHLSEYYYNPSTQQEAANWIRTARQGNRDFQQHYQEFQLYLVEAAFDNLPDGRKIDMLKLTLNAKLLDRLTSFFVENESYGAFVKRCKQIADNIKWVENLRRDPKSTTYGLMGSDNDTQLPRLTDSMDWQAGPIAAARFDSRQKKDRFQRRTENGNQQNRSNFRNYREEQQAKALRQPGSGQRRTEVRVTDREKACFDCGSLLHYAGHHSCPSNKPRRRLAYAVDVEENGDDGESQGNASEQDQGQDVREEEEESEDQGKEQL
jgi:hypothetical protein